MQRHPSAIQDARGLAGIEIEDHRGGAVQVRRVRQQDVLFDVAEVGRPEQRRLVVAEDVVDSVRLRSGDGESFDPRRRVLRRVLFVEMLAGDPSG